MAKDYYPRLSQAATDNRVVRTMMNQQTEIALLVLAPLVIVMIVFMPFFIELLYSGEFIGIVRMTEWLLIGSLIKAGSWGLSFVFLAKGDGRLFLFNELGRKSLPCRLIWSGFTFSGWTVLAMLILSISQCIFSGLLSSRINGMVYHMITAIGDCLRCYWR